MISLAHKNLDNGELEVHYQPRYLADSLKIAGFEALVRWNHPEFGLLSASKFIGGAENDKDLIDSVNRFVITESINKMAELAEYKTAKELTMGINFSPAQIDWETRYFLLNACKSTGVAFGKIDFELTETAGLSRCAACVLARLRDAGVSIVLDDFGVSTNGIDRLSSLPISILKIDKSHIEATRHIQKARNLVLGIVALAKEMKIRVVAEGVEYPEQLAFLKKAGVDEVQGFLLSKPLPSSLLTSLFSDSENERTAA